MAGWDLTSWKMNFQSVHYMMFLPLVVGMYFLLPPRWRQGWLLFASYYFYFFAAPEYGVILLAGTVFTYLVARWLGVAKTQKSKNALLALGLVGMVGVLVFFKYNSALKELLIPFFARLGIEYNSSFFVTAKAVGISFYTFTGVSYLIDVWRGDKEVEKNIITHGLFLGFFASVVSGPISRAGDLMPQLKEVNRKFDLESTKASLLLMGVGFFKKLAVADSVAIFVRYIYSSNLGEFSGLTLVVANIGFMLQLYFDFSGYSDIALGSAGLLGIKLPRNFNTPYFATNFSGFWTRWHISLSTFLQDYIFTPLVWSRWTEKLPVLGKKVTKPPMLSSIGIVFLVSGIWHGDTLCFLVWGGLQAAFRIGEELLHRRIGKPKKNPPLGVRVGKTLVVLVLWTQSLIFFRVGMMQKGSVVVALQAFARQFTGYSAGTLFSIQPLLNNLYDAVQFNVYNHKLILIAFPIFTVVCLGAAILGDYIQFAKLKGADISVGIYKLTPLPRWGIYYFMVLACFAGFILQSGGFGGANFIYGGF